MGGAYIIEGNVDFSLTEKKKGYSGETMERGFKRTLYASYIGYIVQAVVNNLPPLLFLTFQKEFELSLEQIGFLVTYNFSVQIITDFLAARYAERIGYKVSIVAAHFLCAAGLIGLTVFPYLFGNPYAGLLAAITLSAIGGGLIEVLLSPIVEALPLGEKSSAMSLLHSFYCWGFVVVVLLSTLFFETVGIADWRSLALLWALLPLLNAILFLNSRILVLGEEGTSLSVKKLFSMKMFWLFLLLMICSGASEQAMGQWASYFAESGLKVSKTLGDLLGPCLFAVLQGVSRTFYGKFGERIPLRKFMSCSGVLCVFSYLLAVFAPHPVLALAGCALCGLSVGIMWPGTFSLAAGHCPQGGTAMFAFLALGGDMGCASGPSVVGMVSERMGENLRAGLLAAVAFPVLLLVLIQILKRKAQ